MQEVIVEGYTYFSISVAIVWANMLPSDNKEAAVSSAHLIRDSRVRHFHDPNKLAGKAVAARLGSPGMIAWDIYLFFSDGLQWRQHPSAPVEWAHQLSDTWASPKHFHWNEGLVRELERAMKRLSGTNPLDK